MHIPLYLVVLLAILALFPCFAIGMVLLMKIQEIKGDSIIMKDKLDRMNTEVVELKAFGLELNNKFADVSGKVQAAEIRAISTTETIQMLANKWNSREREIAKKERQERKEEPEEQLPPVIDLSQQYPPNALPLQLPEVSQPQTRKRRFGEN